VKFATCSQGAPGTVENNLGCQAGSPASKLAGVWPVNGYADRSIVRLGNKTSLHSTWKRKNYPMIPPRNHPGGSVVAARMGQLLTGADRFVKGYNNDRTHKALWRCHDEFGDHVEELQEHRLTVNHDMEENTPACLRLSQYNNYKLPPNDPRRNKRLIRRLESNRQGTLRIDVKTLLREAISRLGVSGVKSAIYNEFVFQGSTVTSLTQSFILIISFVSGVPLRITFRKLTFLMP